MICTFFGHRDCEEKVEPFLSDAIECLIKDYNADTFYVGTNGKFDKMAKKVIERMRKKFINIKFYMVLAYMPKCRFNEKNLEYSNTVYPGGLENVPPHFAIDHRNRWMVRKSDFVIALYTT